MNRKTQHLLLFSLALTGFESVFGQEINVHMLDPHRQSVSNEVVWVQFYEAPANRVLRRIQLKTGADGVAHLQLQAPLPTQLTLSIAVGTFWCAGVVNAPTEEILTRGAVGGRGCALSSLSTLNPKSGEVVIFVRRMTWRQRLLATLEKE